LQKIINPISLLLLNIFRQLNGFLELKYFIW